MSKIDDLIQRLCPDGVEYKPLGEVGSFIRGQGLQKKDFAENGVGCIHYGQIYTHYKLFTDQTISFVNPELAVKLRHAHTNDLVIATTSENDEDVCKAVAWLGKSDIVISGDAYIYRHEMNPKYVSYLFQSSSFQDQKPQYITGTKVRRLSGEAMAKIRIPVPPLPVQEEIVRILDSFTSLETELEADLEAELEARKKQYEYYRHLQMAFGNDVPKVELGKLVEVRSGWGFPNAEQGLTDGDLPFYKVSDMNLPNNETVMSASNNYVTNFTAHKLGVKPAPAGSVIFPKIGAAVATNKKRLLSVPSAYDNNVMGLIPGPKISSGFLYHWMQTLDLSRLANDSGAVPSITKSEAERVIVPLPDLTEQHRIVSILNQFDVLVHNLSSGLPAEIAARRKQYEYYRDRLLTFKELTA